MKAVIAIAVLLASSYLISTYVLHTPESNDNLRDLFNQWKVLHGVSYADEATEEYKFGVFVQNHRFIEKHNSEDHTSQVGHNQFSDLTSEEFGAIYANGEIMPDLPPYQEEEEEAIVGGTPTSWDWTTKTGINTPIKNQGQCGSCWAFAGTEVLESLLAVQGKGLQVLSPQNLVDCDTSSSKGCNGGITPYTWAYAFANGLMTNASYPYTAVQGTCKYNKNTAIKTFALKTPGWAYNSPVTLATLQTQIYRQPMSVSVQADQSIFQLYKSGILGAGCGTATNHAVVAVGYDTSGNIKIRNSWGNWGVSGYATIATKVTGQPTGGCGILSWGFWPNW